jgi:hypothetical protein
MYHCIDSDDADELLKHLGAPYTDSDGRYHEINNMDDITEDESNEFWNRGIDEAPSPGVLRNPVKRK